LVSAATRGWPARLENCAGPLAMNWPEMLRVGYWSAFENCVPAARGKSTAQRTSAGQNVKPLNR
jgi:hypothetical protein